MSRRLFSEFLDDSDSRSVVSAATQDFVKRRKTSGLNSRFDRMCQTMNVTHRPPARKRAGSTSSASGSSVPKTPIDNYDEFHREAKLGPDFSVIKMGTSSIPRSKKARNFAGVFPWDQDSSSDTNEPPPPAVPLPAWLATTFSTLTTKHPLRLLLPRRTESEPTPSPAKPVRDVEVEDDNPFSFHVSPPQSSHTSASADREAEHIDDDNRLHSPHTVPLARVLLNQLHSQEPAFVNSAPSFTSPPHSTPIANHLTYPAENTDPFYHNEHNHNGSSSPTHSAYNDIYATPAPRPVYFNSPTEDPSDSDPLEPSYELDSLDFRWEPFIQKAGNEQAHTPARRLAPVIDDYYYEIQMEPEGEDDEDGQLCASINLEPMSMERCVSPGPFSFAPPRDFSVAAESSQQTPTTPDRSVAQFFAPAPGIFISPLRNTEAPTSPRVVQSAQAVDDPKGSQTSNDSIEEWDDAVAD
ncbi:hypothetical protein B0H17DRAFT_1194421 [Mycena rosella]|uniref:Uncharacterized protein n=1 Tax=Mycena rosella TaxID=1033263 RepID=A0AAD7E0M6_MYCRO|nr:hypothetical protein B0H17DRAFT_1194421 [Mycena rosella]